MAGVGKTAFAVHAAHWLALRFPDGQIFLPLHGHTPGQRPVAPADALVSLLQTAGLAAQQIPAGLAARTALWRDRVSGKRLLLVLDDASDSQQVRPLLPAALGSLVLITSRRHLTALEDARAVSLDTLPRGRPPRCWPALQADLAWSRRIRGRTDRPAVRPPAAGHRDAGPPTPPPPGLDPCGPGRRPRRGARPARPDDRGEPVVGCCVPPVLSGPHR